jgi:hypothetical protein
VGESRRIGIGGVVVDQGRWEALNIKPRTEDDLGLDLKPFR